MKTLFQPIRLLLLTGVTATGVAQEVTIPDFGLNAAIRGALQKPNGPLTEEDMLSLTNLSAYNTGVQSLEGLGAAHNLTTLDLRGNGLTSLNLPAGLTNLTTLLLFGNNLTNLTSSAAINRLVTAQVDFGV